MGMESQQFALKTREVLTRLIVRVITHERPTYRYGEVTWIDSPNFICKVTFGGGEPVNVALGSHHPTFIGQLVRVWGRTGDLYVDDVIELPAEDDAKGFVYHGADATVPRPLTGKPSYEWMGSVKPDNWTITDTWVLETGLP